MVTWVTTEKRRWKDVERGETIETASGLKCEVLSNEKSKTKGLRVVKVKTSSGVFTKKVEGKKKTSVVLINGKSAGKGKGVDFGKLAREQEARHAAERRHGEPGPSHGAAVGRDEFNPDPWRVDPADTLYAKAEGQVLKGNGGPWDQPQDKAEKRAVDILGAKLLGVQTEPGGIYAVPTIDRSAIRAHMMLMHGKDIATATEDELLELHKVEHERPTPDLYVPHHHSKERPA